MAHASEAQDRGRVVDVPVPLREADHDDGVADVPGQGVHGLARGVQEGGPQEQVLRRITRDRELGKHHQIGRARLDRGDSGTDPLEVPADVPDHDVDLGHGQTEGKGTGRHRRVGSP